MINYEENWLITLLLHSQGSVAGRSVLFAGPAAAVALLLLIIEDYAPEFRESIGIDDVSESQTWTAVTVVVMALLAFRTRQALARFWEGTGLLHMMRGEWYDSVSCLLSFSRSARESKPEEVAKFRHTLVRLMSLCHGSALQEIKGSAASDIVTINVSGLDTGTLDLLRECKDKYHFNRVEVLLHLLQTLVTTGHDQGLLKIPSPILSRVYQTLSRGFVNLLNAKKITDTRFPFPYAQLIAMLLFLHMVLTPMMITVVIRTKFFAALITFVVIFGMFGVNFIASELENPFGSDQNDLPLAHFQNEMNNSLLMLLNPKTDHVATTAKKCVMQFEDLNEERFNKIHRTQSGMLKSVNRNNLTQDILVSPRDDDDLLPCSNSCSRDEALTATAAIAQDDVTSKGLAVPSSSVAVAAIPQAPPPPVPPATEPVAAVPMSAAPAVITSPTEAALPAMLLAATLAPESPAATPVATTEPITEKADLAAVEKAWDLHPFVTSLDSLNETLKKWMEQVEHQMAEPSRCSSPAGHIWSAPTRNTTASQKLCSPVQAPLLGTRAGGDPAKQAYVTDRYQSTAVGSQSWGKLTSSGGQVVNEFRREGIAQHRSYFTFRGGQRWSNKIGGISPSDVRRHLRLDEEPEEQLSAVEELSSGAQRSHSSSERVPTVSFAPVRQTSVSEIGVEGSGSQSSGEPVKAVATSAATMQARGIADVHRNFPSLAEVDEAPSSNGRAAKTLHGGAVADLHSQNFGQPDLHRPEVAGGPQDHSPPPTRLRDLPAATSSKHGQLPNETNPSG